MRGAKKLIANLLDGSVELYDQGVDPGEKLNIAGSHPGVAKGLKKELARFEEESWDLRKILGIENSRQTGTRMDALKPEVAGQLWALGCSPHDALVTSKATGNS